MFNVCQGFSFLKSHPSRLWLKKVGRYFSPLYPILHLNYRSRIKKEYMWLRHISRRCRCWVDVWVLNHQTAGEAAACTESECSSLQRRSGPFTQQNLGGTGGSKSEGQRQGYKGTHSLCMWESWPSQPPGQRLEGSSPEGLKKFDVFWNSFKLILPSKSEILRARTSFLFPLTFLETIVTDRKPFWKIKLRC